jgi:hypothetical protein
VHAVAAVLDGEAALGNVAPAQVAQAA